MPPTATPPTAPHLLGPLLWLVVEAGASLMFAVAMFAALWHRRVRPFVSSSRRVST
jgi:hypothetical protein